MATKKADETLISLGDDFKVQAQDGGDEVRFRHTKGHISSALSRFKTANKNFKMGQRCELLVRIVEEAPEPATVNVKMRAEDVGSLPNDAVVEKSEPTKPDVQSGDKNNAEPV